MSQCQCETPVIDWDAPDCDGTCRRCAGDLSHTLVTHKPSSHAGANQEGGGVTAAMREWYASRSTAQVRAELRGAREAYAAALPFRATSRRARVVCESNERAIPMLEALLAQRES